MSDERKGPRPCNDFVLVEVLDSETQMTASGMVASTGDRMYKRARVLAVGPGRPHPITGARCAMLVEPGQLVVYAEAPWPHEEASESWLHKGGVRWHSGEWTWPGPGDRALMPQSAIVAVLEREDVWLEWPRHHGGTPSLPENFFDADAARGRA